MSKGLEQVGVALEFLEKATQSKEFAVKLEEMRSHHEVVRFAAEQGYSVNRETLAEAMKILVDRSLAAVGIPSWVRSRSHVAVHD